MPGIRKIVSKITVPPTMFGRPTPIPVTTGIRALRSVLVKDGRLAQPLRFGGAANVVHAQHFQHLSASGSWVSFHRTVEESPALHRLDGPRIIIAASGMMTGGRVLHHRKRLLPHRENLLVLVGYQA